MEEGSRSSPPMDWSLPAFTDPMPSRGGRRRSSLPFLNLTLLIIILPILALLLIIFALPPVLSLSSQILKPNSAKKGGDYLIMLVVIFAGFCAIFNRRNDEEPQQQPPSRQSSGSSHIEFFNFSDHKMPYNSAPNTRLQRRTSSYPDLRQLHASSEIAVDRRYRFFDDFELSRYRSSSPVFSGRNNIAKPEEERIIPIDTFTLHRNVPPPSPPPQSITPQLPPPRQTRRYQTVSRKGKSPSAEVAPTPSAPLPSPPPPAPIQTPPDTVEMKGVKLERKQSSVKKELRLVLSSIYNQRKRKKKTQKRSKSISVTSPNLSTYCNTSSSRLFPPPSPPPPPPPPPSVFHNLFKRENNKSKRIHSVPPPPRPPPLRQPSGSRPPLPKKVNNNSYVKKEIVINTGGQSPLIPPPPPYRVADTRYPFHGDFVKLRSEQSSRCSSPESDVGDEMSIKKSLETDGGDESKTGSVFCPSPDVNIKADTFIAKLRGEWRLEKINSLRAKQSLGLNGLGP